MKYAPRTHGAWGAASPSFLIAAALGAFMLFLGVRGLVSPSAAAHGFGLPLGDPSDVVWLRVKGGRDLSAALAIGALLAWRQRRALGAFLLASVVTPFVDLATSLSAPLHDTSYALAMHGSATVAVLVLGLVLVRPLPRDVNAEERAEPRPQTS